MLLPRFPEIIDTETAVATIPVACCLLPVPSQTTVYLCPARYFIAS
jgi:hypothetical protein